MRTVYASAQADASQKAMFSDEIARFAGALQWLDGVNPFRLDSPKAQGLEDPTHERNRRHGDPQQFAPIDCLYSQRARAARIVVHRQKRAALLRTFAGPLRALLLAAALGPGAPHRRRRHRAHRGSRATVVRPHESRRRPASRPRQVVCGRHRRREHRWVLSGADDFGKRALCGGFVFLVRRLGGHDVDGRARHSSPQPAPASRVDDAQLCRDFRVRDVPLWCGHTRVAGTGDQ